MLKKLVSTACMLQVFVMVAIAQEQTNVSVLQRTSVEQRKKENQNYQKAVSLAKEKGWQLSIKAGNGNIAYLVGVDDSGMPIYFTTENNVIAAATTRANVLWPGGSSGLNLTGSPVAMKDKIGIWDGGRVLDTHLELAGRVIQKDLNPVGVSDHSTHVAGTMIASGVNPVAKGMSYESQRLVAYDFNNDASEMSGEAPGLLLSNHSYGTISGWYYSGTRWEFWGRAGDNEDINFGLYNSQAQMYDSIAYNAPFYLIVKSAGNNRSENGPAVGQPYYRYNAQGTMAAAGNRPAGIYSNDAYDIIPTSGTAKNVLTVGAIGGLPYGYTSADEVSMSSFSSWGPTDDGRIKPDIVANGVNVLSSISTTNNSYASYSGTSMASPNATGSLFLLQQYYAQIHGGVFMRSATLKAIAIHTADEAGTTSGPDYRFGWGVLNVGKGAEVIKSNNTGTHAIFENSLNNGDTYTLNVVASGSGPLVATIVWTDPKALISSTLDDPTPKLVNDLDIRINKGTTTFMPWIMDPANPGFAATTGDNVLDNVEKINIDNPIPGATYTITIQHKGSLARGFQPYSLIVSGIGGQAYCTSAPSANTGARIDSVSFAGITKLNTTGCTTYSDFTDNVAFVQPGQILPFAIKTSSCDASNAARRFKVFIDYNNNGSFEASELAASNVAIDGISTANIAIPSTVTVGNTTLMRVIVQETTVASDINSCGTYGNGETQDYRVNFISPSNDLSLFELVSPTNGGCNNPAQLVTIRVKNSGNVSKSNVPLSVVIKNGATTVATLTGTYPSTIDPQNVATYTFLSTFNAAPGTTYSFEVVTSESTDQNRNNDTLKTNVFIANNPVAPAGAAEICGTAAILKVSNPTSTGNYFWYTSATSNTAVASGANTTTTTIPASNTYYVGTGARGAVGVTSKSVYPNGGGYLTSNASNFLKYSAATPVILEASRLYVKYPGKVDIIVADITNQTSTSYSYSAISTTTIDVYATSPTPAPGTQNVYDAADAGADFNLNIFLPAGDHAIIVKPVGNTNLFRSNNVTGNPYPFKIDNLISITGNSALQTGDPNYFQTFYYYLYNMKVRTADCVSDRAPVVASVVPTPTISLVGDSLVSSIDTGNQWKVDGLNVSGGNTKSIKPVQSGTYTVVQTGTLGCERSSAGFVFIMTAVDPVTTNPVYELSLAPNPSKGNFMLKFRTDKKEDLRIDIISMQGQVVHSKTYPKFVGSLSESYNLKNLSAGLYVVKVQQGTRISYGKIMIEK